MSTPRSRQKMMLAAPILLGVVIAVALLPRWTPLGGSALLLVLLVLALGPAAEAGGRMYLRSFQAIQHRSRSRRVRLVPGLRLLARWLRAQRSPAVALLLKDLLTRSRSVLTWLRLLVLPVYIVLVMWLHGRGVLAGVNDLIWTVGGSSLLLLLYMMDSQPSPLGGEGARLTLLLSAPVSRSTLLRSKWEAFFWTHLPLAGVALVGFGWHFGLGRASWLVAGATTLLTLLGLTTLFAWGSVADVDLEIAPEGSVDTFLLEEAPVTLPRLMIVNLGGGFLGAVGLLLWFSPPDVALPLLATLDLALLVTGWHVAHRFLWRALQ